MWLNNTRLIAVSHHFYYFIVVTLTYYCRWHNFHTAYNENVSVVKLLREYEQNYARYCPLLKLSL
jgi:hypothetical protein